jgi:hypothetical protein
MRDNYLPDNIILQRRTYILYFLAVENNIGTKNKRTEAGTQKNRTKIHVQVKEIELLK